ncbi:MAG: hypothetical protein M3Z06_14685 [Actinomycetota bacterium]|nr:hypothetical protein [Actinomycetota bacterium]
MAFWSRTDKVAKPEHDESAGGWYSDPYGHAARRWYDNVRGWSDRIEGKGQKPEKTGVQRLDDAAGEPSSDGTSEPVAH